MAAQDLNHFRHILLHPFYAIRQVGMSYRFLFVHLLRCNCNHQLWIHKFSICTSITSTVSMISTLFG